VTLSSSHLRTRGWFHHKNGSTWELVKCIVVMPFVGDPVMAERWTAVLREMTDLRVVSLSGATQSGYSTTGR
jgi:hypothetical protein